MANWLLKGNNSDTTEIAAALGVPELIARLIVNRGIKTYEEARYFLDPAISRLPEPFEIEGVKKAAEILLEAMKNGDRIAIYSDYDVDGVMSAVILSKCLSHLGADFIYYVPDRTNEGYGLNTQSIRELKSRGASLIIACDNGISAVSEAKLIYELGMKLIIIDHHEPLRQNGNNVLPLAEAIINPKTNDYPYSYRSMCAAGLCYRFAEGLFNISGKSMQSEKDLLIFAAIATVCDIVDLLGDNRIIVKNGLSIITRTKNPGLRALIERYGLEKIGVFQLGFIIGPAINASGRLESAEIATELFLTDDETRAREIAGRLYELNVSRREMTEGAYSRLCGILADDAERKKSVYVLYDEDVHESVAGIVAGRIKERFNHPTIVITKGKDCAKGSARGIDGYNVFDELSRVSSLFIKFGGHSLAAGFSIPYEKIDELGELLNRNCTLSEGDFVPKLLLDARLPLKEATFEFCSMLETLAPYGKGNKEPLFGEKNVKFNRIEFIGKEHNTVKVWLKDFPLLTAISFNGCERFTKIAEEKTGICDKLELSTLTHFEMDIVFCLAVNEYRGVRSLQLILKDFR